MRKYVGLLLGAALLAAGPALAGSNGVSSKGGFTITEDGQLETLSFGANLGHGLSLLGGFAVLIAAGLTLFALLRVRLDRGGIAQLAIFAAAAVLGIELVAALPALAQAAQTAGGNVIGTTGGDTVVTLPYGQWVAGLQAGITTLLTAVATAVVAFLPFPVRWAVNAYGVDRLVKDAVGFAVTATPGASKDAHLDLDVGSRVLARALQKAVDEGAPRLIKAAGGLQGLQDKILAQMKLQPDVSAVQLVSNVPGSPDLKLPRVAGQ